MAKAKKHKPYVMFKGCMERAGYDMGKLAQRLKQTQRTITNKINGTSDFSLEEGRVISALFGMPQVEIFLF